MSDPLAELLHNIHAEGPPYECTHDTLPEGHPAWFAPRCVEEAARIRASGVRVSEDAGLREAAQMLIDTHDHRTSPNLWCDGQCVPMQAIRAALRSEDAAPRCDLACGHHGDHWLADAEDDASGEPWYSVASSVDRLAKALESVHTEEGAYRASFAEEASAILAAIRSEDGAPQPEWDGGWRNEPEPAAPTRTAQEWRDYLSVPENLAAFNSAIEEARKTLHVPSMTEPRIVGVEGQAIAPFPSGSTPAAPQPDPEFGGSLVAAHPSPADAPAPQRPDPLAALLHDLYVSGPPYGCEHDLGPVGDYVPRCIEDAARLRAAGAAFHTITPECGPICWTTGHHHDVETCDGCRRLADMMHAAGMALATAHPSPADAPAPQSLRDAAREVVDAYTQTDGDEVSVGVYGTDRDHRQYDSMLALRAALDAPALTVERLAEALVKRMPGYFGSVVPTSATEAVPYRLNALYEAAAILRALEATDGND